MNFLNLYNLFYIIMLSISSYCLRLNLKIYFYTSYIILLIGWFIIEPFTLTSLIFISMYIIFGFLFKILYIEYLYRQKIINKNTYPRKQNNDNKLIDDQFILIYCWPVVWINFIVNLILKKEN